jgi:hypothetical protein
LFEYSKEKTNELVNKSFINENSCEKSINKNIEDKKVREFFNGNNRIEIVQCLDINESFTEKDSKERFHEFNLEIGFKTIYSIENKCFANNCLSINEYLEGSHNVKLFKIYMAKLIKFIELF